MTSMTAGENGAPTMKSSDRWFLSVAVILVDLAIFFLPLAGLFAAYVVLARPPWFKSWVERLYADRA